jgi:hypothetical protein
MARFSTCMAALRVLARSNAPNRAVLVEQYIDEYLKTESVGLTRALERLRRVKLRTVSRQQAQRRTGLAFSSLPPRTCGALEVLIL